MNPMTFGIPFATRKPTDYLAMLQQSMQQATAFAARYPDDANLWAMVRTTLSQLLYTEWRAGRLLGQRAAEAYFVRCDATTMTRIDLDSGRLVALVGVALVKPAEFQLTSVVQQSAGPVA